MSSPDTNLKESWALYLAGMRWDWFLTVTFKEPVPMRRQESVINACRNSLESRHHPGRLFLAAEPHLSKTLHVHGLYQSQVSDAPTLQWIKKWERVDVRRTLNTTYGRSWVEEPRVTGVYTYVSKYCIKQGGYYQLW